MRIKSGQDLGTALLFVAVGAAALWISADYPRGTPQRPGTGVLPVILSWCLIGTGALIGIQALLTEKEPMTPWAWRPIILVTLATVSFGLLIDDLGLIVTMIISLTLCALGTPETRWAEYAMFLLILIAIGVSTFIWLLGMPITTWPIRIPTWLAAINGR